MSSTITTPGRAARLGLAATLAGLGVAVLPGSALAHGTPAASKVEEKRLYRAERAILGPAHAAEHRRHRAAMNDPRVQAWLRRDGRRARERARRPRKSNATVGSWTTDPFKLQVMGIHAAMLPTGKVMFFSYPTNPSKGAKIRKHEGLAVLWDPVTGRQVRKDPPINTDTGTESPNEGKTINIWCGGQSFLANGHLLVTGGNYDYQGGTRSWFRGLKTVLTFDPWKEEWTRHPDMRQGRWYPTQTLQPDGRTLIMSGLADEGVDTGSDTPLNKDVEIFTPAATSGGRGTVDLASGPGHDLRGLYPHMWVMPSGRTLVAGPYVQDSFYLTLATGSKTYGYEGLPNLPEQRYWGSGVLMPGGPEGSRQVMLTGGAERSANNGHRASTVLFTEGDSAWRAGPAMTQARAHHNTVLLPDGSMVSMGGGYGQANGDNWVFGEGHKSVDVWDPASNQWRAGPRQVEGRAYHSTALLLPDGRVVSAGDDSAGGEDQDTAEVYSPPYLFKGPRPTIEAAPEKIGYGTTFAVNAFAAAGDVTKAVLVAPGAVTHANDMNQRLIELSLTPAGSGRVALGSPGNAKIAPPGWYMLFVLDANGVPSVARWVRLDTGGSDPDPGPPSPRVTGTAPGGTTPSASGSASRRALALGTFEARSISPWRRRAGAVARVRTGHRGRYALALRAQGGRAAVAERRVTRLRRGSYDLELWMRGRELQVRVDGGRRRTFRPSSSRRWSRIRVPVRVSRTWASVRITLTGRSTSTVRVDDVTLTKR